MAACASVVVADGGATDGLHAVAKLAAPAGAQQRGDTAAAPDQAASAAMPTLDHTVPFADVRRSLTCQLCNELVASSLVLNCSHLFCGACIFEQLSVKPQCPACQVNLRALPVRCPALDSVAAAYAKSIGGLPAQEAYLARAEEGKAATNKLNKMFWWLQSPMAASGPDAVGGALATKHAAAGGHAQRPAGMQQHVSMAQHMGLPPAPQVPHTLPGQPSFRSRVRLPGCHSVSSGGAPHQQQHLHAMAQAVLQQQMQAGAHNAQPWAVNEPRLPSSGPSSFSGGGCDASTLNMHASQQQHLFCATSNAYNPYVPPPPPPPPPPRPAAHNRRNSDGNLPPNARLGISNSAHPAPLAGRRSMGGLDMPAAPALWGSSCSANPTRLTSHSSMPMSDSVSLLPSGTSQAVEQFDMQLSMGNAARSSMLQLGELLPGGVASSSGMGAIGSGFQGALNSAPSGASVVPSGGGGSDPAAVVQQLLQMSLGAGWHAG